MGLRWVPMSLVWAGMEKTSTTLNKVPFISFFWPVIVTTFDSVCCRIVYVLMLLSCKIFFRTHFFQLFKQSGKGCFPLFERTYILPKGNFPINLPRPQPSRQQFYNKSEKNISMSCYEHTKIPDVLLSYRTCLKPISLL